MTPDKALGVGGQVVILEEERHELFFGGRDVQQRNGRRRGWGCVKGFETRAKRLDGDGRRV